MVILGIDPGLRVTGYGVVEVARGKVRLVEGGVLRVGVRGDMAERLADLHGQLGELMGDVFAGGKGGGGAGGAGRVAVEELYAHYKHPRTAILMGHARGVILLAAAQRGLAVSSLASTMVKRTITGNGHAGKRQVQRAVAMLCGLKKAPEPADVADAIAIAWTAARGVARVGLQGDKVTG